MGARFWAWIPTLRVSETTPRTGRIPDVGRDRERADEPGSPAAGPAGRIGPGAGPGRGQRPRGPHRGRLRLRRGLRERRRGGQLVARRARPRTDLDDRRGHRGGPHLRRRRLAGDRRCRRRLRQRPQRPPDGAGLRTGRRRRHPARGPGRPKRCGHFEGKEVVPTGQMLAKLESAPSKPGEIPIW